MQSLHFQHQLFGAWRAAGLDASPRPDGTGVTFGCPRCASLLSRLEIAEGVILCPECGWGADGEPWSIAAVAAKARPASAKPAGLPLLDLATILAYEPNEKEEIWPGGILSAGLPTAIVGAPGVGKSRLSLQAAIATLLGWKFLGWETRGQGLKWLFLQTENSTRRLKADLGAMTRHLTEDLKATVHAGLRVLDVMSMDFATICMTDGHPDRGAILRTLEEWQPDIVVIDPLRDAGQGDPNKDADMTSTCQGIASVVRKSNPRRAPLIIHHGRTGAQEASRVFGDDAPSFARNSKVLYGWLRSQINVAPAGIEHPGVVIVGCGKCSDGPKWEPFAARLNEETMTYRRLERAEFDLEEWSGQMTGAVRKKRAQPSAEEVAAVVAEAGGEVGGGLNAPDGLMQRVSRVFGVSRAVAQAAIDAAKGATIEATLKRNATDHGGGKPQRIYVLKPNKSNRTDAKI
jgi:hypothetical protein